MVKKLRVTSRLIGRFCQAAEQASLAAYPNTPLTRYAAALVVPDQTRAEVAVMKAVTVLYVMRRAGAKEAYARQRALLAELVDALLRREGRDLEPWIAPEFRGADDDASRLRVVIDQVASLTDGSAVEWHARLCA